MYSIHVNIFFLVTSVKCENCHEVLFSSSKKDVPKEKLIEPAEVTDSLNEIWRLWNALNICRSNLLNFKHFVKRMELFHFDQ